MIKKMSNIQEEFFFLRTLPLIYVSVLYPSRTTRYDRFSEEKKVQKGRREDDHIS